MRKQDVLSQLVPTRGAAQTITCDNGTDFTSQAVDLWADTNGVTLDFIRPGKPVDNAFIESFNGRLRVECLKSEIFLNLEDAKRKLQAWKQDYNHTRPHGSVGGQTPPDFLAAWRTNRPHEAKSPK